MRLGLSSQAKGVISLILLSLVTASMGLFARSLSESFFTFQQVYVRISIAFILALIIFYRNIDLGKIKKIKPKEWGLLLFRSFATYVIGVAFFTQAIITAKFSNVYFIEAIPLIALFGIIFFKEKLTRTKFLFLSLAFVGVLLVGLTDPTDLLSWGKEEIIILISAIGFAFAFVFRKYHSNLLNNKEITIITFFISIILLFITSLLLGEGLPSPQWTTDLVLVALCAGLFNVFFLFFGNYGFQKVEAILANNIYLLEVPFAVLIGFLFYAEVPALRELLGGMLIVTSVIGMNQLGKSRK